MLSALENQEKSTKRTHYRASHSPAIINFARLTQPCRLISGLWGTLHVERQVDVDHHKRGAVTVVVEVERKDTEKMASLPFGKLFLPSPTMMSQPEKEIYPIHIR
jgi:hypothetical protein